MKLVNLTPHPINLGSITLEPAGPAPRCATITTQRDPLTIGGVTIPVEEISIGDVAGLPEPQEGLAYIVSRVVAEAAPERRDLYIPNRLTRDERGRVTGCESLGQVSPPKPTFEAYRRISADGIVWVWDSILPQWRGGDCERYDTVEELEAAHGRTWHANIPNDRFVAPELLAMILEDRYFAAMDEAGTDGEYDEAADAMKAMGPIIAEGMARRRRRPSDV